MCQHWPARELPKIDIGGTEFYLDLRLWQFREVEDFSNQISIDQLIETDTGFKACFDPRSRNLFEGTQKEYEGLKDTLAMVELPSLGEMDPVGWEAYVKTWKEENPALVAIIEQVPIVLDNMPVPKQKGVTKKDLLNKKPKREPLLPKKRLRQGKGKKL